MCAYCSFISMSFCASKGCGGKKALCVFVVGFNFCVCMFRKEEESGAGGGGGVYSVLVDGFVVYRLGIYK